MMELIGDSPTSELSLGDYVRLDKALLYSWNRLPPVYPHPPCQIVGTFDYSGTLRNHRYQRDPASNNSKVDVNMRNLLAPI